MFTTTTVAQGFRTRTAATLSRVALLLLTLAGALAQTTSGQISGSVLDSSGQVIVGATVTLRNKATGDMRVITTNATGDFLFPALGPGTYAVLDPRSGVETDLPQPKPDDEYTYRAPDQQDWVLTLRLPRPATDPQ